MKIYFLFGLTLILLTSCGGLNTEKSDRLVEDGVTMLYQSKYDDAIVLFTKAINYNPENFEAYYYRGNCLANQRKYQDALNDFSSALKYNSKYAEAYANRGQMKFYLQDRVGACEDWKMAEVFGMPNMSDKTRHCE